MADSYSAGVDTSFSSSDPYTAGVSGAAVSSLLAGVDGYGGAAVGRKKNKESYTPWGFFGNLLDDTEDAIKGIYPFIRDVGSAFGKDLWNSDFTDFSGDAWNPAKSNLGEYTGKVAPAVAEQYKTYYGPTAEFFKTGDPTHLKEQLINFYDEPIQIIGDALLGVGVAAKAGVAGKTAGIFSDQNALVRLGKAGEITIKSPAGVVIITKQTPEGRPVAKLASKAAARAAEQSSVVIGRIRDLDPALVPVVGEYARVARAVRRLPQAEALKWQTYAADYGRTWNKLSTVERQAVQLHMMFPVAGHLDEYRKLLDSPDNPLAAELGFDKAQTIIASLDDPKVRAKYDKLSASYADPENTRGRDVARMVNARAQAARVAEKYLALLQGKGRLDPADALMRQYLPTRFATGARFVPEGEAQAAAELAEKNILSDVARAESEAKAAGARADRIAADAAKTAKRYGDASEIERIYARQLGAAQKRADKLEGLVARRHEVGQELDALNAEMADMLDNGWVIEGGKRKEFAPLIKIQNKIADVAEKFDRLGAHIGDLRREMESIEELRQSIAFHAEERIGMQDMMLEGARAAGASAALKSKRAADKADELRAGIDDAIAEFYGGWQGGEPVLALQRLIEESGQPQPVYLPHRMTSDVAQGASVRLSTGGGGGPQRTGLNQNRGVLMETGLLTVTPDLLGPAFLRRVQVEHYDDLHKTLMENSIEVADPALLPRGYKWLRRSPSERIPYTTRTAPAYMNDLTDFRPELDTRPKRLEPTDQWDGYMDDADRMFVDEGFWSDNGKLKRGYEFDLDDFDENLVERGTHGFLAVPENLVKSATGEFTRSSNVLWQFVKKPTRIWRILVLGLRPGYLVNNTVSNHLLYAIRFAGWDGLRAYLNMVYNTSGAKKVRELLRMPETPRGLSKEFMEEFFPTQVEGTFIGTQTMDLRWPRFRNTVAKTGLGKKAVDVLIDSSGSHQVRNAIATGVVRADRAIEAGLRRAATEAALRKDPAVKKIADSLDSQTKSFERITEEALRRDPELVNRVNAEVNAALGDYLKMSALERGAIRDLFPFYAWFKAITKVTLRLPLDLPVRTALLSQLSQVAYEFNQDDLGPVPSFLEGAVNIGGVTLKTTGLNPFETLPQLRSAAGAILPGAGRQNARDLLSTMNPFIGSVVKQVGGLNPAGQGLIGGALASTFSTVPQMRLVNGPTSELYDWNPPLAGYMGVPVVKINERQARKLDREGR